MNQCATCGGNATQPHSCGGTPTLKDQLGSHCGLCNSTVLAGQFHYCSKPISNPTDPLVLSCEVESLRKKLDAANLQIDGLKETEAELRGEITKYRQVSDDMSRLIERMQKVVDAAVAFEVTQESCADLLAAVKAYPLKRKCICPDGLRTAIAHMYGCPASD